MCEKTDQWILMDELRSGGSCGGRQYRHRSAPPVSEICANWTQAAPAHPCARGIPFIPQGTLSTSSWSHLVLNISASWQAILPPQRPSNLGEVATR